MGSRADVKESMQSQNYDRQKAWVQIATTGFYTKEDIDRLYEKYGPYVPDLIRTAQSTPSKFGDPNSYYNAISSKECLDNLLKKDFTPKQIGDILGKPEGEIRDNITRYKQSQATSRTPQSTSTTTRSQTKSAMRTQSQQAQQTQRTQQSQTQTPKQESRSATKTSLRQQSQQASKTTDTPAAMAEKTYQQICNAQDDSSVSIETLLAAGVTPEDFQAVFEKDQTLAFNMGNSPLNNAIVDAAKNQGIGEDNKGGGGNCGLGVKAACDTVPNNPISRALYQSTPQSAIDQGIPSSGASGYYARLEASGECIVLTTPNKAYVDISGQRGNNQALSTYIKTTLTYSPYRSAQQEMKDFTDQLPRGTIITWDNHVVTDKNGKKKPLEVGHGMQYGHVCIKATDPGPMTIQKYKCDITQYNPHATGWYGENIHMCYNIDCQVPKEYALQLIEQAQERTGQCLDVEANKRVYEESKRAKEQVQSRSSTSSKAKTTSKTKTSSKKKQSSGKKSTSRTRSGRGGR